MTQKNQGILLSIILVTYNHESYICEALDSVLNQDTQYNFEIIVVDDCSTDKTPEIIETYLKKYPDTISYLHPKENVGVARYAIFETRPVVKGKYWAILEGDDFWIDSQKIQKQLSFLEKNQDHIGVTSAYMKHDTSTDSKKVHKASLKTWTIQDMFSPEHSLYSHTSTWIWRNVFGDVEKNEFFWPDELKEKHTLGDVCLSFFMAMQGGKITCFDEAMTCYQMTGKGNWSSLSEKEKTQKNKDLYEKIDQTTKYQYTNQLNQQKKFMNKKKKLAGKFQTLYNLYKSGRFPILNKIANRLILLIHPILSLSIHKTENAFKGKIFCIGSGKTGTTSLEQALLSFGYDLGPQARAEMLTEDCHNGNFDKLIRFCNLHQAFQDAPFCWADYYKVLDKEFPNSKFILTVRDSGQQWFSSLSRFHTKIYSSTKDLPTETDLKNSSYGYRGLAYDNYVRYFNYPKTPLYDENEYVRFYDERNQEIMDYFKDQSDRLLVLNVKEKSAYHKLGKFLGIDTPIDAKFPWLNKT